MDGDAKVDEDDDKTSRTHVYIRMYDRTEKRCGGRRAKCMYVCIK